jgi:hypothetical protein
MMKKPWAIGLCLSGTNILHRRRTVWKMMTYSVRFDVFTAVTMKNGVFWDVTPCDSCKNRRFGGT